MSMLLKLNLQRFASETWVLNETLSGELQYEDALSFYCLSTPSKEYSAICFDSTDGLNYFVSVMRYDVAYFNNSWDDQAYRTLVFNIAPTGDLLTWLQVNGTKQATQQTIEKGTYVWNSYLDVRSWLTSSGNVTINANFNSNDTSYSFFQFERADYETYVYYNNTYAYTNASTPSWLNDNFKTIELISDAAVDSDFYTWFTANTTKQQTSHTITYNLTNCTSDSSNPTTIESVASVIVTANRGYKLPSTITVTNATYTYEQSTGMIDLSNPTRDVTITVVAIQDDIIVYENQLTSIANAIRQVNSSSAKIKLDDMPNLIGTFAKPTGTKTITDTNVTDVRNYANAQVSDANLASANIVTGKTILGIAGSFSSDGTLDASKMLKGVIGYSKGVKYTGTIETYSGSTTITSNGTINTAGKYLPSNLTVNVPATPTQEKSVTITTNGETSVTPDTGKNLSKVTITTNVPSPTLTGDATAEDVLEGKTFYNNSTTKLTGTLVPLTYEELLAATYPVISGETWVLNESLDTSTSYNWNVNFICNGHNCTVLSILKKDQGVYIAYDGDAHGIYLYGQWGSTDEWKTFVFETAPTGDLLTWLQANGTKQ